MNCRHSAPNCVAKELKRSQWKITWLLAPCQNCVDSIATGEKGHVSVQSIHPPVEPSHPEITLAETNLKSGCLISLKLLRVFHNRTKVSSEYSKDKSLLSEFQSLHMTCSRNLSKSYISGNKSPCWVHLCLSISSWRFKHHFNRYERIKKSPYFVLQKSKTKDLPSETV